MVNVLKKRNTRQLRIITRKRSQVRIKDQYKNVSGIKITPFENITVKMCEKTPNIFFNLLRKAFKSTQNALSMYQKRNTWHFRPIAPKCSQVRIKDQNENISGIQMRPCWKNTVKKSAKNTENAQKSTQKAFKWTQNDYQCTK